MYQKLTFRRIELNISWALRKQLICFWFSQLKQVTLKLQIRNHCPVPKAKDWNVRDTLELVIIQFRSNMFSEITVNAICVEEQ